MNVILVLQIVQSVQIQILMDVNYVIMDIIKLRQLVQMIVEIIIMLIHLC